MMTSHIPPPAEASVEEPLICEALPTTGEIDFRFIELLFFAYRQFTGDADSLLAEFHFGRAHHRILHFVNRAPGMTIADLLELLDITKQSLSRVLRPLLDEGYVVQKPGPEDRRQRCLFPTKKGRKLTLELSRIQTRRIDDALNGLSAGDRERVASFLYRLSGDGRSARSWLHMIGAEPKDEP